MAMSEYSACGEIRDRGPGRREVLGAAVGGVALAASRLFVPVGLAGTEAREGALGGEMGGRRGKDHKGRHRQRNHGDKKEKGNSKDTRAPGAGVPAGLIRYVAIRARGAGFGDHLLHVSFYYRTLNHIGQWSALKFGKFDDIPYGGNVDYAPKMYAAAVHFSHPQMPYPTLIEVRNPLFSSFPLATVVWGCTIDGQGNIVGGTTYKKDGATEIALDGSTSSIDFRTGPVNSVDTHIAVNLLQTTDDYYWINARVDDTPPLGMTDRDARTSITGVPTLPSI